MSGVLVRVSRRIRSGLRELPAQALDWAAVLSKRPEVVAFSHPEYLGVTISTQTLFDDWLPLSEAHISTAARRGALAGALEEARVGTVVFSGFARGYAPLIRLLKRRLPQLRILAVWHGTTLQNEEDCNWTRLSEIVALSHAGLIDRVGFLKAGMAELMRQAGLSTAFLMNYVPRLPEGPSVPEPDGHTHVGLWNAGRSWRKNPYAMAGSVAFLRNAALSGTLDERTVAWCRMLGVQIHRIHAAPIARATLLNSLGFLHCNLYVTLSECSPLLPLESLSVGAPCLVSPTSHLFEDAPLLRDLLTVREIDDPRRIADRARTAIDRRAEIISAYRAWAPGYNQRARRLAQEFLSR